jgi:hypothetical protein
VLDSRASFPLPHKVRRNFPSPCDGKSLRAGDLPVCAGNFHFRAPISRSVRTFSGSCGHFSIRADDLPFRAGQLPVHAAIFPSVQAFFDLCGQKASFFTGFGKNPKGISSFSPALADEIGPRRVNAQNSNQPGTG